MNCSSYRMAILFLCLGFLCIEVSGITSLDLALRWRKGDQLLFLRSSRVLEAVAVATEDLQVPMNLAPAPATMFDPNQSNKRRIRRGSDPIHNRCWYIFCRKFLNSSCKDQGQRWCLLFLVARLDAEIEKFLLPHKLNTYRFVQFILFYFYLYFPFFFSSFFFLFVLGVEAFVSDRRMRKR